MVAAGDLTVMLINSLQKMAKSMDWIWKCMFHLLKISIRLNQPKELTFTFITSLRIHSFSKASISVSIRNLIWLLEESFQVACRLRIVAAWRTLLIMAQYLLRCSLRTIKNILSNRVLSKIIYYANYGKKKF